jgi:hypothetical protein
MKQVVIKLTTVHHKLLKHMAIEKEITMKAILQKIVIDAIEGKNDKQ